MEKEIEILKIYPNGLRNKRTIKKRFTQIKQAALQLTEEQQELKRLKARVRKQKSRHKERMNAIWYPYAVTLTFPDELKSIREDPEPYLAIKYLKNFLVGVKGFYIFFPELSKKGKWHFHGYMTDVECLSKWTGQKKIDPIRDNTHKMKCDSYILKDIEILVLDYGMKKPYITNYKEPAKKYHERTKTIITLKKFITNLQKHIIFCNDKKEKVTHIKNNNNIYLNGWHSKEKRDAVREKKLKAFAKRVKKDALRRKAYRACKKITQKFYWMDKD